MRTIGVLEPGGPEALRILDAPDPRPAPGHARVRVAFAAVSPTDALVRSGAILPPDAVAPHVPGMDFAGVVDATGVGSRWAVGDRVMGMALPSGEHGGAYVSLIVAPDDSITLVPEGLALSEASTLPMNGLTALQALDRLALPAGATLAVTGGAGVLAGYLIELAVWRGLRVVADASPADRALVASFGAAVVVPRSDDFASAVRAVLPEGADGLADTAVLTSAVTDAVRDGGAFVSFRGWDGTGSSVRTVPLRFETVSVSEDYARADRITELGTLADGGLISPRVADVLDASDAAFAHRRLDAGGTRGRLVLAF